MKKIIVTVLVLGSAMLSNAQKLDEKINQIFTQWNQKGHPGCVLQIMKKNEVIYSKAYGMANIKYNISNDTETIFNIGSISKQFTAMGIVKLYLKNKLSFDDDIRKYLPELYDFKRIITIRHLLHHTSGFRSTPELFALAGWREGDAITMEDNYRYLCKQTSLNFNPGEHYMYSNSNYILLAKIIENITHQSFQNWMKDHIFSPLNMMNTFVDESNSNEHPKVATPYYEIGENQLTRVENTSLDIGASNIYTTISDLTKWMSNFHKPMEGWENAFTILQTTDTLNNGKLNNYAFGVFVEDFFGNKRIQHSGGIPGFLSFAEYYPQEELTIVLLTNFTSTSVPKKQMELLQLFLKNNSQKEQETLAFKSIPLDIENAKKIVGDYWNVNENYSRKIYLENGRLWYLRNNGAKSQLIQIEVNKFLIGGIKAQVVVEFNEKNNTMIVTDRNKTPQLFEKYNNTPLTELEKSTYIGKFYSQELETYYYVKMIDKQLIGYHSRHGEFPIKILKRDIADWSGMAITNYVYNEKGEITGFYLNMNRVKNVWFQKVKN